MKTCFDQAALEFEGLTAAIKEEAFELVKDYLVVLKASPMPDVRGVEIPFEFELGDGIVIRGFIDRIDNTPSGVKIVDYKTTKNAKYLDPFQLSIYGLWLRKEDPALKEFDGCYVLLRHKSTTKDYKFNARDLDRTHKELMTYANRIKSETVWSTSPSPLCKYCDFKDLCENEKAW
jgi:putative RecB family exonuclease